jgi:hypothetical protein
VTKKTKKTKKLPEGFDYVSSDEQRDGASLRASKRDWRALLSERRENDTYEDLEKIERAAASTAKTADTRNDAQHCMVEAKQGAAPNPYSPTLPGVVRRCVARGVQHCAAMVDEELRGAAVNKCVATRPI